MSLPPLTIEEIKILVKLAAIPLSEREIIVDRIVQDLPESESDEVKAYFYRIFFISGSTGEI